jgi:hypothetical protein
VRDWHILLTDKEELLSGEGIQDQGSYSLAINLRKTEMGNARFFNFDACGVGDTLIISTTAEYFLKNETGGIKIRASIKDLREDALKTARNLAMEKVILAPTPFSDDLGFLQAGVGAQTITMLPSEECNSLISTMRGDSRFTEALVNHNRQNLINSSKIPATWRSFNSPRDSYITLTPEHFRTVMRFAEELCK